MLRPGCALEKEKRRDRIGRASSSSGPSNSWFNGLNPAAGTRRNGGRQRSKRGQVGLHRDPMRRMTSKKRVPAGGRSTKPLNGYDATPSVARCERATFWCAFASINNDARRRETDAAPVIRRGSCTCLDTPHFRGDCASPVAVGLLSHACDVLSSPSVSADTTEPVDGSNARVGIGPNASRAGNVSARTLRRATSSVMTRRITRSPSTASAGFMTTMAARFATTPVFSTIHPNGKRRAQRCAIVGMARSSPKGIERHPCHDG